MKRLLLILFLFSLCFCCSCTCNSTKQLNNTDISSITTKNINSDENYTLQYIYPENTSKEQAILAEKLYSQIDDSKLCLALEKYVSDDVSNSEYDEEIYEVKCSEYYNDFDGNGKNELFVYRSVYLHASTPDHYYRDLWYTDGETVEFVTESTGRNDYSGVIELDNGPDLFYCMPNIVMGAPWQITNCYIVSDGKPVEYVLPNENQYFAFIKSNEVSNIYIGFLDDDGAWEIAKKSTESDEPIQTFSWVDGEIRIVSGCGAEIDNLSNELKGYLTYDWLSEYEEYADSEYFNIDTDFYFMDLDDDATYELLRCMHFNYPQGGHIMYIYDYIDDNVICLGQIESGTVIEYYEDYIEEAGIPIWLSDNVVDIYKSKTDGTFRYLSRNIHCGERELYVYFDTFSIEDNTIKTSDVDGYAAYTTYVDDATAYEKWHYKIADNTTDNVSDWEQYFNKQFEEYEIYNPTKKTLHAKLDCTKWLSLYSEDKASLENAYNIALSDLITELNCEIE